MDNLTRNNIGATYRRLFTAAIAAMLVVCVAPYLTPIRTPFDLQPYSLILACACLWAGMLRISLARSDILLVLPLAMGILLVAVADDKFSALRSAFGFASVLVFSMVARILPAERFLRLLDRVVAVMLWVWLLAAIAQLVYGKSILQQVLPALRDTGPRGFTSLAPEPYYYAVTMFLILLYLTIRGRERSWLCLLCLVQIVLLAQSALVVLMTIGTLLVYALVHASRLFAVRTFAVVALLCSVVWGTSYLSSGPGLYSVLEGSRLERLMRLAIEEPSALILVDQSGSERAAHIYFSVKGASENFFLPRGYDDWQTYFPDEIATHRWIFHYGDAGARIASGFGGALFELGVLGVAYPVYFLLLLARARRKLSRATVIVLAVGLGGALLGAVPLATPLVGLLFGVLHISRCPVAPSNTLAGK